MNTNISFLQGCFSHCLIASLLLFSSTYSHCSFANETLWQSLKEGGKVVLMRHAPVNKTAGGNSLIRDPSCQQERNLSAQGSRDAKKLGQQFKQRNIPVSGVLHSPYCRTTDTAKIVFGTARPVEVLSLSQVLSPTEAESQTEQLSQLIGSYSGKGNLILISHEPNIRAISFEPLKHLDFVILEPSGDGDFEELGVIRYSDIQN